MKADKETLREEDLKVRAELRVRDAQLRELKADIRLQSARCWLMAAACRYFGEDALLRAGVSSAPARQALREQGERLIRLFGDPLPGSDCVVDALDLLLEGHRGLHQTRKDRMMEIISRFTTISAK